MITIPMKVAVSHVQFKMKVETLYKMFDADEYDGPMTFTPSNEEQTIEIKDKMSPANITIEKIPSNYGLITYNGSVITVS